MKCFNEVFVPSGWIITTNEAPQNLSSTAWPQVQETCENVFDLTILTNTKNDEEPNSEKHQLILNFIYGNNGTGKTTILKIINNLVDADAGIICVPDCDWNISVI